MLSLVGEPLPDGQAKSFRESREAWGKPVEAVQRVDKLRAYLSSKAEVTEMDTWCHTFAAKVEVSWQAVGKVVGSSERRLYSTPAVSKTKS